MQLADILQRRGLIDDQQAEMARQQSDRRLDQAVVQLGYASEEETLRALGDELGLEFRDLKDIEIDEKLLMRFPTSVIFRHQILPLAAINGHVEVATSDPFDLEAIDELSSNSGVALEPVLSRKEEIGELIKKHLGVGGNTINELVALREEDEEELHKLEESAHLEDLAQAASVIRLVNEFLTEAMEQQASDVHIEPHETGLVIRYRVDGLLRVQSVPPEISRFYSAIVTRLKIMADLNIAEKRLPQDGRIEYKMGGREIDIRVSIIPMIHGEGVVLRLLDKERMLFSLETLGLPRTVHDPFSQIIEMPHGIFLVTGPTGSGKTTTLYCALNAIKRPSTKIITVEDPVEYQLGGISQIQVHPKIGLTFAACLRSILRHDPDVVLVGEIRDLETAQNAIQASLTGHFVFSTLHTNDAPSAFTRLIDMGVEPFLASSTVEGVMAQRLVRRLCTTCREEYRPNEDELPPDFPKPLPEFVYRPKGCRDCKETGYRGRQGIFELLHTDEELRHMVAHGATTGEIRNHGMKQGMQTLRMCGWDRVIDGTTSVEEVMRVTKGDIRG